MLSRTYRWDVAGKVMVTVFPADGSKVRPAEAASVVYAALFVDPRTARVWVRAPQATGGAWSQDDPGEGPRLPRSTVTVCGKALEALSQ